MARWLQLDGNLINLDRVTVVRPRVSNDGSPKGAFLYTGSSDGVYTTQSVDEVLRLIETAEGPEPPKALITDHDYDGVIGAGAYECSVCRYPLRVHAK